MRNTPKVGFGAILAFSLFGATSPAIHAHEVDNYTSRNTLTRDALVVLDQRINKILQHAIHTANQESPDRCSHVGLRQEIVRWTGPDPIGVLEFWAVLTDEIQHTQEGVNESIYAGVSFRESMGMWVGGIGRSLRLNGHIVGTDKLGHFFMQGLSYFNRVDLEGANLDHVMQYEHHEDGYWGLSTSGVMSYADMAANYQGYRFWHELYQGGHPYVRCAGGKHWVKARNFSWADYVNDAWDEAINCSEMLPSIATRVEQNLKRMGLSCPIDVKKCAEISQLDKARYYVSPYCQDILNHKGVPTTFLTLKSPAALTAGGDIHGIQSQTPSNHPLKTSESKEKDTRSQSNVGE